MRILIFTATYNEVDNIASLVSDCLSALPEASMLVVDDASPDGTGALLDQLVPKYGGRLMVIHRPGKLGLGTAHKLAMKFTLENDYDALITMDADYSHHPKYLPTMVEELKKADFVTGSRYVKGGKCDYDWKRQLLSRCANTLARLLLGIKLHETTTSYRGFRKSLLEKFPIDQIRAEGYAFFFESIFHACRVAENVGEFPIHFEDRRAGSSKISKKEITRSVVRLFRMSARRMLGLFDNPTSATSKKPEVEKLLDDKTASNTWKLFWTILTIFTIAQTWFFCVYTYRQNLYGYHDFGFLNYVLDSTLHGNFMRAPSPEDHNHFSVHIHYIYFLVLPFKWVFESAMTLHVAHCLVFALSGIALAIYAKTINGGLWLSMIAAVLFWTNPYTYEIFHSAHYEMMYVAPMVGVFAALAKAQYKLAWAMLLLAFGAREDYAFLTGVSATVIGFLDRKHRKFWWSTTVVGIAWFLIARIMIMPHLHNPNGVHANVIKDNWGEYGSSIPEIMLYFATHPFWIIERIFKESEYVDFMNAQLWLPWLSPYGIGTLVPMSYIVTYKTTMGRLCFYFSCAMLPFYFVGTLWFLNKLKSYLQKTSFQKVKIVALGVVILGVAIGSGVHYVRNVKFGNKAFPMCFLWQCSTAFPTDPEQDYVTRLIEEKINVDQQSASVPFRQFSRALWRPTLTTPEFAYRYRPCHLLIDSKGFYALTAASSTEAGRQGILKQFIEDPEYQLVDQNYSYYYFQKRSCF